MDIYEKRTERVSFDTVERGLINLNFIETPYEDIRFIMNAFSDYTCKNTLFIEQGSPKQPDHIFSALRTLSESQPDILEDFKKRRSYDFERGRNLEEAIQNSPFAITSEFVKSIGGVAVNMDLSGNITGSALSFMRESMPPELMIEFIYHELESSCFSWEETIPKIMQTLLPSISDWVIHGACKAIYEVGSDVMASMKRDAELREWRNYYRREFMRETLRSLAVDGDYVLCHPNHVPHIKAQNGEVPLPAMPVPLFNLR